MKASSARIRPWALAAALLGACLACAQGAPRAGDGDPRLAADLRTLRAWRAGQVVSDAAVAAYGADSCFVALDIDDGTFARMRGRSYKEGCPVARADLRYLRLLHRTLGGQTQLGELVCHKDIAPDLVAIFRRLYAARYPIERMVLIDEYGGDDERSMADNNTSCFNHRNVPGTATLSKHSRGRAIDVNPRYNPYVRTGRGGARLVSPANGRPYASRAAAFDYKISRGDLLCRLFAERGFAWGGDWRRSKDYQHFEK